MEKLLFLTEEEMNQIGGGGIVGWCIGVIGYLVESAANSIASHPVGGPRHYEI